MQKPFYASGFLYNLKSQQILLLQTSKQDAMSSWSMIGGESSDGEEALSAFQRVIRKSLDMKLENSDIYPIYDYLDEEMDKINYVFYAEIKTKPNVTKFKGSDISWVSFSELSKLSFTPHTKQDLIVGERVINLKQRVTLNIQ